MAINSNINFILVRQAHPISTGTIVSMIFNRIFKRENSNLTKNLIISIISIIIHNGLSAFITCCFLKSR